MALSDRDRDLLTRCLARRSQAWCEFVDRFVGLVFQVVEHEAQARSFSLSRQDRDDLAAEVFLALVEDDYRVLRRFRGESSLATYLTVISRRVVVREMLRQKTSRRRPLHPKSKVQHDDDFRKHFENLDLVRHLLEQLNDREARLVQMFYLNDLKYHEIAAKLEIPENSVGPTLARARQKMQDWLNQSGSPAAG